MGRFADKVVIHFSCLCLFSLQLSLLRAEPSHLFRLEEMETQFPSRGFEVEIQFWREMFTHYRETQVVFHDRQDLRLIYAVVEFERGIEDDSEEGERQGTILEKKRDDLRNALLSLAEEPPDAQAAEEEEIEGILTGLGYETGPALFRRLASQIRYQRGLRERFAEGIAFSGQYLTLIEQALAEEGVPEELAFLPHVESGFRASALSKAGAAGLWQFVRGTARQYMTVNASIDERLDPIASTRAAARLLRANYEALGSWPLAITAYNHGRAGMLRAKKEHGPDLRAISRHYRSRLWGFASRNFYPEFLAAVEVARNYRHYFGEIPRLPPLEFETVRLPHSYRVSSFEDMEGLDGGLLRAYNPFLTSRVWKQGVLPAGIDLRIPGNSLSSFQTALKGASPVRSAAEIDPEGASTYTVRRGDTVGRIARRFASSISAIQKTNSLGDADLITPGQKLIIPGSGPVSYRVKSGDTLLHIAQRFRTSLSELLRANDLANPNHILLGQVLLIP